MIDFCIKLADIPLRAEVIHPSTKEFCRDYLTNEKPEFSVSVSQSDIDAERESSVLEQELEGLPVHHYSDSYLETLALYRAIVTKLLDYDILLFHGSALEVDGEAYIFTAKSGTGKTTHTLLWEKLLGDKVSVVNGDKPLLKITGDKAYVCGTPWQGKENLGTNKIVPLKAICILNRGTVNTIEQVTVSQAVSILIQQSYKPEGSDSMLKTIKLLNKLCKNVKLYSLKCNMELEAAEVSYNGMRSSDNA